VFDYTSPVRSETGTFGNCVGEDSYFQVWRPDGPSRAGFLLVHGLGEHSGRYEHVAEFLTRKGVTVYALDQLGHGRSGGQTGWIEDFAHFLDDLETFDRRVRKDNGERPLVLFGHYMGGLIVTAYLLEKPLRPDLLVLSSPAIEPIISPEDRSIDPTRLSRDPALWEAYMNDPLTLRDRVTDDLLWRLADGVFMLPGRADEIEMPVLLIHGEDDRLCSLEGAESYVRQTSSKDVTIKTYPEGRHEMLNEINKEDVLADLGEWLDARLP
jgi:alpha-beta hydrolase superfamily lysophospholipase